MRIFMHKGFFSFRTNISFSLFLFFFVYHATMVLGIAYVHTNGSHTIAYVAITQLFLYLVVLML